MRKIFIYAMWGFVFICIAAVAIVFTAIAKGKIGYVPGRRAGKPESEVCHSGHF